MILAVVIIGAFFLPYFSLGGLLKMSGLDIILAVVWVQVVVAQQTDLYCC